MSNRLRKPLKIEWTPEKLKALNTCRDIHKLAEEFYQYLAEAHHEHRDIAAMWSQLALDKCNHSDTFKMVDKLEGNGIREINISADFALKILAKMKSIPKKHTGHPPSILAALRFSTKMEESLNRLHFSQVVKFLHKQDSILMTSTLKSSGSILHMITEEYLNRTVLESEPFKVQTYTGTETSLSVSPDNDSSYSM